MTMNAIQQKYFTNEKHLQVGYFFTVTDEQMLEHRKRSIKDIFMWLESANSFIHSIQTPEERQDSIRAKNFVHR
ncbi:MAG: hypothetical protein NZM38_04565 [Cytophagales bacterium]|nr:hypothetical protein [Cytophagales bacterium]MDW8384026.1 hypothetical protein [Flammeovirgaceae bacterium]